MLRLLQAAFEHDWTVTMDYMINDGNNNGVIIRVWVTK